MPTYKNNTDKRITHHDMNYIEWQPGESKELSFFVPHELLGLSLVSHLPDVKKSVHDWSINLMSNIPESLELPYHEAFELSLYCNSGNVNIFIGDNTTPIIIKTGESHFSNYTFARCPKLRFFAAQNAILHVKVEERNTKNTLNRGGY